MRSPRPERRALAAALVALCCAVAPAARAAPAPRHTQTATAGTVTATLSYVPGATDDPFVTDPRLRIDRAGAPAFDQGISTLCDSCQFFEGDPSSPAVSVADLDSDGEPEVLVDAFSGGAHCCTTIGIYDYRPALGTYGHISRFFGNGGYVLQDADHDGRPELVSQDDSFAYRFANYADSADPPQVLRYVHTPPDVHLQDVTRQFGQLIRGDAAYLLHRLRGRNLDHRDLRGALAAYVADQYLLGHGSVGLREIAVQGRRGRLGSTRDTFWPGGRRFAPALLGFLHQRGYR